MTDEQSMDESFMRRCIALAEVALANGETPVGALLVRGDRVIAEATESTRSMSDPSAHAEIQVVRLACVREESTDLSECTMYTSVEPCVMCSYVIRSTGISRVVYGAEAARLGGVSSRYAILLDAALAGWITPPSVTGNVLSEECAAILRRRTNR